MEREEGRDSRERGKGGTVEREVREGQWRERYGRDSGERGKEGTVEREVREGQWRER